MYWQHSVNLPKQSRDRALYVHVAFISTYSILYLNYFVLIKTASTEPEIPIHHRHDESKNVITAVHVVLCTFYGPILNEVIKQWPRSKSQLQIWNANLYLALVKGCLPWHLTDSTHYGTVLISCCKHGTGISFLGKLWCTASDTTATSTGHQRWRRDENTPPLKNIVYRIITWCEQMNTTCAIVPALSWDTPGCV